MNEDTGISPRSWISSKVEVSRSAIHGSGMHAREKIEAGEVVFVKGGHVLTRDEAFSSAIINSYQPISNELVIGARTPNEEPGIKLFLNHGCRPNCGLRGETTFVAIRDIEPGAELLTDYAFIDDEEYSFTCSCGLEGCRRTVTGRDWMLVDDNNSMLRYFSAFLQDKIRQTTRPGLGIEAREPRVALDAEMRAQQIMPAEFEAHSSTWMLWPIRPDIWRQNAYPAQQAIAVLANSIAAFEQVTMGVAPGHYEQARAALQPNVRVVEIAYDDIWIRDTGPTFAVKRDGSLIAVDWFFNAWGGLGSPTIGPEGAGWNLTGSYFPWKNDDLLARKVAEYERTPSTRASLVLEGGAIAVDGEGTVAAVRGSIVNKNRNGHMAPEAIEQTLSTQLGTTKTLWLPDGLPGDETDGHVDNVCMFAGDATMMVSTCSDPADPRYQPTQRNLAVLSGATDALGRSLRIIQVELPPEMRATKSEADGLVSSEYSIPRPAGSILPASYANAYVCNGAVIVPGFACELDPTPAEADAAALRVFAEAFPTRKVVQVPAREILLGGGGLHCVVQQVPRRGQ